MSLIVSKQGPFNPIFSESKAVGGCILQNKRDHGALSSP